MTTKPHVPFATANYHVHFAKYSTSLDPRGYIPVYEYVVFNQPILWDRETGYVYWTGIWKAMGRDKSEIAKLVDTNTMLSCEVKKIRGGCLKIQGTWLSYERTFELAIKTCWYIRDALEPIFGPTFLRRVLEPSHPNSSSRVPISLEERVNKAMKNTISRKRAKALRSGIISPPTTPRLNCGAKPIFNVSIEKDELFPLIHSNTSLHVKRQKYENFNHEFVDSPRQLGEAIYASLCLQRLSVDDGSRPSTEIIYAPPISFIIGKQEFQFVDQQYRLAVKC